MHLYFGRDCHMRLGMEVCACGPQEVKILEHFGFVALD